MVRSIDPPGVPRHKNPIPAAALKGGLLASSAISGLDVETGAYPQDKAVQVALAFGYVETVLDAAGCTPQDVVRMDLYFNDKADRRFVNPHWIAMYPDETARPARHAHIAELPHGCCLQITLLAVTGDRT
ncbi:RidA family protein [Hoeflea poritis]|uniref:RidA family protein n=1 Tax=Hoeflea poritis TaxID=2993659 RepID=A0ABT4VSX5_9HYPH|nr:RidA family protein [Hoeflea poritis]MDA4847813.1 RidA family protein [Hoeflea poritis]